jgi:restriction system protein
MESFVRVFTVISLFSVLGFGLYWVREYKKKTAGLERAILEITDCNREMKKTLLAGLIKRFDSATPEDGEERPLDFERFVAKILRCSYGGRTSVTKAGWDQGIGIEHRRGMNLHLGQVRCLNEDTLVDYQPVAVVHSQVVKQGAAGGFVATTSEFTGKAKKYAEDLNVDLIDGSMLVELWAYSLARNKEKQRPLGREA